MSILSLKGQIDISIIYGDGTATAAKKGGDNLRFSRHKHIKGDKVVAFCVHGVSLGNRSCNAIAPFVSAPNNRNESSLLKAALPLVTCIAKQVGLDMNKTTVSLDGVYDSRANRKAIFDRGMIPMRFERISKLHYALKPLGIHNDQSLTEMPEITV